ncbi:MAG: hypothetical protein KIS68_12610 [Bauldia sp.]|nr:hypothetical protein [Bauldia sp.]
MLRKALSAGAVLVALSVPASASTQELLRALYAATLPNSDVIDRAQRLTFAQAGLAYWVSFDSRIPRNSPATQTWLLGELNTTDTERLTRVINGPEYALWRLEILSTDCVNVFTLLVENLAWHIADPTYELYLWLKALPCFYNPGEIGDELLNAGLSNGRYDGAFAFGLFGVIADTITGKFANSIVAE